jgi:hypothetical protein
VDGAAAHCGDRGVGVGERVEGAGGIPLGGGLGAGAQRVADEVFEVSRGALLGKPRRVARRRAGS